MSRDRIVNRDYVRALSAPQPIPHWSATQFGSSSPTQTRGKRTTDAAPMIVSTANPFALASSDEEWVRTYSASQDSVLSMVNGLSMAQKFLEGQSINTIFKGFPNAYNANIYKRVGVSTLPNPVEQVQFVGGGSTVESIRETNAVSSVSDVRSIGLRMPQVISGWGKTRGLRPTDPEPQDARENDDEHKLARETWKVGPLDVRWNENFGVWSAFNDLITGQNNDEVDTIVFGTNMDDEFGFPFLKGYLSDAWWVRRTSNSAPNGRSSDKEKSGEVTTTMRHKLFDPNFNGAAPLWDVFVCFEGSSVVAGSETTLIGGTANTPPSLGVEGAPGQGTLAIRTSSRFALSQAQIGPIKFTSAPLNNGESTGSMKFVDGEWVPVIDFEENTLDLCRNFQYVFNLATLVDNSKNVMEDGVFELQNQICEWSDNNTLEISSFIDWLGDNLSANLCKQESELPGYVEGIVRGASSAVISSVRSVLSRQSNRTEAIIQSAIAQIIACIRSQINEEFSCPVEIGGIGVPEFPPVVIEAPLWDVTWTAAPGPIFSFGAYCGINGIDIYTSLRNPCRGSDDLSNFCDGFYVNLENTANKPCESVRAIVESTATP